MTFNMHVEHLPKNAQSNFLHYSVIIQPHWENHGKILKISILFVKMGCVTYSNMNHFISLIS